MGAGSNSQASVEIAVGITPSEPQMKGDHKRGILNNRDLYQGSQLPRRVTDRLANDSLKARGKHARIVRKWKRGA